MQLQLQLQLALQQLPPQALHQLLPVLLPPPHQPLLPWLFSLSHLPPLSLTCLTTSGLRCSAKRMPCCRGSQWTLQRPAQQRPLRTPSSLQ